jgi:hypothetical protein
MRAAAAQLASPQRQLSLTLKSNSAAFSDAFFSYLKNVNPTALFNCCSAANTATCKTASHHADPPFQEGTHT